MCDFAVSSHPGGIDRCSFYQPLGCLVQTHLVIARWNIDEIMLKGYLRMDVTYAPCQDYVRVSTVHSGHNHWSENMSLSVSYNGLLSGYITLYTSVGVIGQRTTYLHL